MRSFVSSVVIVVVLLGSTAEAADTPTSPKLRCATIDLVSPNDTKNESSAAFSDDTAKRALTDPLLAKATALFRTSGSCFVKGGGIAHLVPMNSSPNGNLGLACKIQAPFVGTRQGQKGGEVYVVQAGDVGEVAYGNIAATITVCGLVVQ